MVSHVSSGLVGVLSLYENIRSLLPLRLTELTAHYTLSPPSLRVTFIIIQIGTVVLLIS